MQALNPKLVLLLAKQTHECISKAPSGVHIVINESDATDIQADIEGPVGTPYEGGIFRCKLVVENDFPNNPPKGLFFTKIFHPNVSEKGEICVNTLKKDWNPVAWSLFNILEVIKCLLIVPFPESALNEEAGKMFMEDYSAYFKHARMLTQLYAMPKQQKNPQIPTIEDPKIQESPQGKKDQAAKKKWMKRI